MPQRKKVTSEIDFVNHETASATCDQSIAVNVSMGEEEDIG